MVPPTVHACPWFGPVSHVPFEVPTVDPPPLHSGQTLFAGVLNTVDARWIGVCCPPTIESYAPVWMSTVPFTSSANLFTTQTGTPAAKSGNGAPNVAPL